MGLRDRRGEKEERLTYMSFASVTSTSNVSYGSLSQNDVKDNSIAFEECSIESKLRNKNLGNSILDDRSISVIANTTNALLGVSIFAMPWGFQQSGIIGGSIITVFVAYIAFETVKILLLAQKLLYHKYKEVKSYPEIASLSLSGGYITSGWYWESLVRAATVISCLGGCVGYLIFLGEITSQLFSLNLTYSVIAAAFPLTLLSWIRSFRDMTIFTIIGVVAIILSVAAILYDGYNSPNIGEYAPLIVTKTSFNFLGPATFLFTIHYCVLSMGAENMSNDTGNEECYDKDIEDDTKSSPTKLILDTLKTLPRNADASMLTPLAISYAISSILIIIIGISGLYFFGAVEYVRDDKGDIMPGCENKVCQNIILNLHNGILKNLVGSALIVAIILGYVLILAPAREHIELMIEKFFNLGEQSQLSQLLMKNVIRTLLVLLTAIVAILAPYFGSVLGAVGGLTDALQSFILPPLIGIKLFQNLLTLRQKAIYYGILLFGTFTIFNTSIQIVNSAFASN